MQPLEDEREDGGGVEPMAAGDPLARLAEGGQEIEGGEVRGLATQPGTGRADDGRAARQADGQRQLAPAVLQVEAAGRAEAGAVDGAAREAFSSRPTTPLMGASSSLGRAARRQPAVLNTSRRADAAPLAAIPHGSRIPASAGSGS